MRLINMTKCAMISILVSCAKPEEKKPEVDPPIETLTTGYMTEMFPTWEPGNESFGLDSGITTTPSIIDGLDAEVKSIKSFPEIVDKKINTQMMDEALHTYDLLKLHFAADEFRLAVFKNRYATLLLKNFGFLNNQRRASNLKLLTDLVESRMGNYALIVGTLEELHGHIDKTTMAYLKSEIGRQIKVSYQRDDELKLRLEQAILKLEKVNVSIDPKSTDYRIRQTHIDGLKNQVSVDRKNTLEKYLERLEGIGA